MKPRYLYGSIIMTLLVSLTACCGRTSTIKGPDPVALLEAVEIGGMKQWLLVRGKDRNNPVLLWLHGGPGAAQMPLARHFNGDKAGAVSLEDDFVVVHWDQRGAGKSNPRKFDVATMTQERFIEDVAEVTQWLKRHFNRERIYLLGHSWGTQLGAQVVNRHPDDYIAFISVSPVIDQEAAHHMGHAWALEEARRRGDTRRVRKLEELGSPPFMEHEDFVTYIRIVGDLGGGMDIGMLRLALIAFRSPEYCFFDYFRWLRGSNRGSGPMWEETRDFRLVEAVDAFRVPVFFFCGRNDFNTPGQLVEENRERIDAPHKELIWFEKSAHMPFAAEPERFKEALLRVRDLTLQ